LRGRSRDGDPEKIAIYCPVLEQPEQLPRDGFTLLDAD